MLRTHFAAGSDVPSSGSRASLNVIRRILNLQWSVRMQGHTDEYSDGLGRPAKGS